MGWMYYGDIMWYIGHILTGIAVVANRYSSFSVTIILVVLGQALTMISRPIGRMEQARREVVV